VTKDPASCVDRAQFTPASVVAPPRSGFVQANQAWPNSCPGARRYQRTGERSDGEQGSAEASGPGENAIHEGSSGRGVELGHAMIELRGRRVLESVVELWACLPEVALLIAASGSRTGYRGGQAQMRQDLLSDVARGDGRDDLAAAAADAGQDVDEENGV